MTPVETPPSANAKVSDILRAFPKLDKRRHLRAAFRSPSFSEKTSTETPSTPKRSKDSSSGLASAIDLTTSSTQRRATTTVADDDASVYTEASISAEVSAPDSPRKLQLSGFKNLLAEHKTTIFDSVEWRNNVSYGFYVLGWVLLSLSTIRTVALNWWSTGKLLESNVIAVMRKDLLKVAMTDLVMYLCMYVTYFIQVLVKNKIVIWDDLGWKLQHLWQFVFLFTFVYAARRTDLPWIARIFLLLHSLTMLMKQHSYAFYNGHLNNITSELETCRNLKTKGAGSALKKETLEMLDERIVFCEDELRMQSSTVKYPENLTVKDFFMFTMYPTLVYQLRFPRTDRIRWSFVTQKLVAVAGLLLVLIIWAEQHIYPIAISVIELRNQPLNIRVSRYPLILSDLVAPFFLEYLVTFYLVWDAILNALAELSMFGDRLFYRDWWNTVRWDKFARDWNVPVHQFLYRHVYHSSISSLNLTKLQATLVTFVLSAMVHELAMFVIFGRIRGYLFLFQLLQLPFEFLARSKFFTKYPSAGIAFFWFGISVGPSILTSLYLAF